MQLRFHKYQYICTLAEVRNGKNKNNLCWGCMTNSWPTLDQLFPLVMGLRLLTPDERDQSFSFYVMEWYWTLMARGGAGPWFTGPRHDGKGSLPLISSFSFLFLLAEQCMSVKSPRRVGTLGTVLIWLEPWFVWKNTKKWWILFPLCPDVRLINHL